MKRKILSLLTAFAMVFGIIVAPFTTASANNTGEPAMPGAEKTEKVTLHKILTAQRHLAARKVRVTKGETTTVKTIVKKEIKETDGNNKDKTVEKYYWYESSNKETLLDPNNADDKAFIDGYAKGEPVFEGLKGLDGKDYNGTELTDLTGFFGSDAKEIANVYFAWQKDFGTDGNHDWKYIDKNGNALGIQDPANNGFTKQADILGGKTEATGYVFDTSKLAAGDYKIVEIRSLSDYDKKDAKDGKTLTGQRAVPVMITLPLVNADGVIKEAHVYPKNSESKPKANKNFKQPGPVDPKSITEDELKQAEGYPEGDEHGKIKDGAGVDFGEKKKGTAAVKLGEKVPYTVTTEIPAEAKYKTVKWSDIMSQGLTFNRDVVIKAYNVDENGNKLKTPAETVFYDYNTQNAGSTTSKLVEIKTNKSGFDAKLTDDGAKKLEELTAKGKVIFEINYSATVNNEIKVERVEKNKLIFKYSNNKIDKPEPKSEEFEKEIEVTKKWADTTNKPKVVTYYLWQVGDNQTTGDNDKVVATVEASENPDTQEVTLPSGIKYTLSANYGVKFTGLKDKQKYYIKEEAPGFIPTYGTIADNKLEVTNKPDGDNPPPIVPETPGVVTGGKKFVKTNNEKDEEKAKRLVGAEFLVKRKVKKDNANIVQYLVRKTATTRKSAKDDADTYQAEYIGLIDAYNKALKATKENLGKNAKAEDIEAKVKVIAKKVDNLKQTEELTGKDNIFARIEAFRIAYENKFREASDDYIWQTVEEAKEAANKVKANSGDKIKEPSDIPNVVKLISDGQGRFEITGLKFGTYFLEEIKAPADYALTKGTEFEFTVAKGSYEGKTALPDNSDQLPQPLDGHFKYNGKDGNDGYGKQIINKEVTIPMTGGIGSLIFIAAGLAIMGGAFIGYKRSQLAEA